MPLMTAISPIDVAVAHPDPFLAAGVSSILQSSPGVRVQPLDAERLDVIVMDYADGLDPPSRQRAATERGGFPARLVISDRDTPWEVRQALEAGVQGYLLPECSSEQLLDAVRSLARGARYLCERIAISLAESMVDARPTPREWAVLGLVADGYPNKEIGRRLGISVGTVKTHIQTLFFKLGVNTRTAAVAQARCRGYLADGGPEAAQTSDVSSLGERRKAGEGLSRTFRSRAPLVAEDHCLDQRT